MAAAVLAEGYAGMGHAELDVEVRIGNAVSDLLKATAGEHRKGAGKGDIAHGGQTCRHVYHVCLGNAGVEETLGELIRKGCGHRGVCKVCGQRYYLVVFRAQRGERFAVCHSYCFLFAHINPPIPQALLRVPRRSEPCRASRPDFP